MKSVSDGSSVRLMMFDLSWRYCLVSMLRERAELTAVCIAVTPIFGYNRVWQIRMPKFFREKNNRRLFGVMKILF